MAIPFILIAVCVASGATGATLGVHSAVTIKDSKGYISEAEKIQNNALYRLKVHSKKAIAMADELGKMEMNILDSFKTFSDCIERIQGRPEFKKIETFSFNLDNKGIQELKKTSGDVSLLLGITGSMATGVAGGFAAAGATTSAISVLCTASTGTAITDLSGIAATNATLSALGGGSLASGGGGMALGSTVLSASSAGIGLLAGGLLMEFNAKKLSDSADIAMQEAKKTEAQTREFISFFDELSEVIDKYGYNMAKIANKYNKQLVRLMDLIKRRRDYSWSSFTEEEKRTVEITVLYVTILYNMCKVQLTKRTSRGLNVVNKSEIQSMIEHTDKYIA
jgi:hypothetical protein